jgi:NAD(P)-dependent dehydrogenase (short-subunit alcohol dehydrogenase family)
MLRGRRSGNQTVNAAVTGTVERFGGIDVLVANAGIASAGPIRTIDHESFERVIEVNLLGAWRTIRACLPYVIERQGYVLAVASVAAIAQILLMGPYAASKAGVEALATRCAARRAIWASRWESDTSPGSTPSSSPEPTAIHRRTDSRNAPQTIS